MTILIIMGKLSSAHLTSAQLSWAEIAEIQETHQNSSETHQKLITSDKLNRNLKTHQKLIRNRRKFTRAQKKTEIHQRYNPNHNKTIRSPQKLTRNSWTTYQSPQEIIRNSPTTSENSSEIIETQQIQQFLFVISTNFFRNSLISTNSNPRIDFPKCSKQIIRNSSEIKAPIIITQNVPT